ncbi:ABC transporter ATP-binding protein [Virgibacillus sp. W0430]|uniref:ABC transporter ATP-binding protein n=1 Tax=Virgibacillus sp. W0430 TaxID=3391580 RepID=UPI003F47B173
MSDLLSIQALETTFFTAEGNITAVDQVSFDLKKGEIVGIVGESGSGKSITSLSIMGLVPSPPGKITGGKILYKGKDLRKLKEEDLRKLRGKEIAMIFQEPMTSLNPVYTIGYQLDEAIMLHERLDKKTIRNRSIELLNLVGIPRAEEIVKEYPHQLSGGMRQRVMIAMAMACNPDLLIADEPTTALDVTIQAQILELLKKLQAEKGLSVLLITHDLGVVAESCQYVLVMYAGQIVEKANVKDIFLNPQHPYTIGLMKSIPKISGDKGALYSIPGHVVNPLEEIKGCRFAERCAKATETCFNELPPLTSLNEESEHYYRCWYPGKDGEYE